MKEYINQIFRFLFLIVQKKRKRNFYKPNSAQQAKMFKAPSSCAKLSASTAAKADAGGAITGALASIYSGASTTGLVFGPGGYVLTTAGAAVSGALWSSGLYLVSGGFF
jgi:hypothetical protein